MTMLSDLPPGAEQFPGGHEHPPTHLPIYEALLNEVGLVLPEELRTQNSDPVIFGIHPRFFEPEPKSYEGRPEVAQCVEGNRGYATRPNVGELVELNLQAAEARRVIDAVFEDFEAGKPTAILEDADIVNPLDDGQPQAFGREPSFSWSHENKKGAPDFHLRAATMDDIDTLVDIDIKMFGPVYADYDVEDEQWRQEMKEKFIGRLEKVGGKWMPVLERDGKVVGFMTCCPTNKTPAEFESWEKTTDNGTLDATYDPDGKNIYVVTLSVLPEGSEAKDMLFANQIGNLLTNGFNMAFFESRIPGFHTWVRKQARLSERDMASYSKEELDAFADEYAAKTTMYKGKEAPYDRLLRVYARVGCSFEKVVADAYHDTPSMNYGVVCVYDGHTLFDGSDLRLNIRRNKFTQWLLGSLDDGNASSKGIEIPVPIPENRFTRWVMGNAVKAVSKSPKLVRKLF